MASGRDTWVRCLAALAALAAAVASAQSSQVLNPSPTDKALSEAGALNTATLMEWAGLDTSEPIFAGFNAALITTTQHDSNSGWASIATPVLSYRFGDHLAADASVPIYTYVSTYENVGTKAKPVYNYAPEKGQVGDTTLSLHAYAYPLRCEYEATASLGIPSGHSTLGLGAGQVTFNLNNRLERSFSYITPILEAGYGDASALVDQRIRKDYISVGPLAHFQAGLGVPLPRDLWFEASAYEELPLSADLIYSTTTKGKQKITTSTNVGPAEDNGFLNSLSVPVTRRVVLSGYYNRSLRNHNDLAGFSLSFHLRAGARPESAPE